MEEKYLFDIKWDRQAGDLTPSGEHQMFLYGRDIRYRYVDKIKLLDENYNPKQIYTMSTNSGRSILSAEAYLNGLYEYT